MTIKKHDYKETNIIYCGDSKDILGKIPDNSVDLIYLDPPFFSHKHYEGFWDDKDTRIKTQFSDEKWEKLKKSIKPNIMKIYEHIEERWKGGRQGIYVYIAYMRERLEQCWRVLKPTGSIYLHCDWHAGHYLKIMMDEIFGYGMFRNELVWLRKFGGATTSRISNSHDIILYYTKSKKFTFNQQYLGYSDNYIKSMYNHKDKLGKYRLHDVVATKGLTGGRCYYTYKGYTPKYGWIMYKEKLQELDDKNRLVWSKSGRPYRKLYLNERKGNPLNDVWADIHNVSAQKQVENLGYPTQKPEQLLDRIIRLSSKPNDIVLDPFCGGGTTLAVAKKLKRKFIGIDISRTACRLARQRLGEGTKIFGDESLEEIKKMNPHDVAELIIVDRWDGIVNPKKSNDLGIDGWVENRTIPVQVKRWEHNVGRPEIDKFKTAIERDNKTKGLIVANGFSRDSYAEVARIKAKHEIDIELVEFKTIFETHNKSHNHNHGKTYIDHPLMMIF